jgi:hypothetical protein
LELKSKKIELKLAIKSYLLFSKSGFTDDLLELSVKRDDIILIDSLVKN